MTNHDDGSALLASRDVDDLLVAAIDHAGGKLIDWDLEHIDAVPGQSTTATYLARVSWPYGIRDELIGVSARVGALTDADERARIFGDGDRQVAVWLYPHDPDLPGLERAAYPDRMAELLTQSQVLGRRITADQVTMRMIGYRPRVRATLRLQISNPAKVLYVKVMRPKPLADVLERHRLLLAGRVPAPRVMLSTADDLLITEQLPGRPLADAIFDPVAPISAESLIDLLDSMPASIARLERRPPWSDAVGHYARMIGSAFPQVGERVMWLADTITEGLAPIGDGDEPTHGDFHEGQLHVYAGRVCGLLDIDTVGPGRRADDLACLVAHLSTVQHMNSQQTARVHSLIQEWVPVFDRRVDPVELRLRAAAVIISLATGPYRGQEVRWRDETVAMVDAAEALVRQVV